MAQSGNQMGSETLENMRKQSSSVKKSYEYKIEHIKLEEDLQREINADRRYWLQNEAKLRAVQQGTLTYQDFRQIVESAHLQPLNKDDKESWLKLPKTVLWNSLAEENMEHDTLLKTDSNETNSTEGNNSNPTIQINNLPKTTTEFLQVWKKLRTLPSKFSYLVQLLRKSNISQDFDHKVSCLETLFREEVPVQVFPDIIQLFLLLTNGELGEFSESTDNISVLLTVLQIITKSKRFQLSMSFLSNQEKNNIGQLFTNLNKIASYLDSEYEIEDIKTNEANADKNYANEWCTQEKILNLLHSVKGHYGISD